MAPCGVIDHSIAPVWEANHVWLIFIPVVLILGGVLAVCVCVCLAAVYLVFDAHRLPDDDLVGYFRSRAAIAAVVAGVVAFGGIVVLRADAEYLFDGLTSRALPLVILSALCGVGSLVLLVRANHRGARLLAIGAVASVICAWGAAQWDYILPETLTFEDAAAPSGTITVVILATGLAALLVVPSFVLLFRLDQRGLLPEEDVDEPDEPDEPHHRNLADFGC